MYAKDLEEAKYQFSIETKEKAGLKNLNDKNAFIEHSSTMGDIFEKIEDYNQKRMRKVLIVFDDMISHLYQIKKHNKYQKNCLLDVGNQILVFDFYLSLIPVFKKM